MLKLSKNSKVGVWGLSKLCNRIESGNPCMLCGKECYAMKAYRQYPNCRKAWKQNEKNFTVENFIKAFKSKKDKKYFRFNSSCGEMNSIQDFETLFQICNYFPETIFYTYTKNHEFYQFVLDGYSKPKNLVIGFSYLCEVFNTKTNAIDKELFKKGYDFVTAPSKTLSNCHAQTSSAICGKNCFKCMTKNLHKLIVFKAH